MQLRWWHGSCRALAYEALGLLLAALTAGSSQQTRQVQLLLESLKRSISQPFQQLPGVIAAFAAEAVFVLMSPGCAMYPPLNKLLLKRSELNIQYRYFHPPVLLQQCAMRMSYYLKPLTNMVDYADMCCIACLMKISTT